MSDLENTAETTPETAPATQDVAAEQAAAPTSTPAETDEARRLSRAIAAAARREQEVLAQKRVLDRERHQMEADRQAFAREREEAASARQEAAQWRQRMQALRDSPDPIAAFREAEIDFEQVVNRMARNGSPENQIDALRRSFEKTVGELSEKLTASEKAREEDREEREAQATRQRVENARATAVNRIMDSWQKYPELTLYEPHQITGAIETFGLSYFQEHGAYPDLDTCAEAVEAELASRESTKANKKAGRSGAAKAPPANGAVAAAAAAPVNAQTRGDGAASDDYDDQVSDVIRAARERRRIGSLATKPKTLTNRSASERATPAKALSREEFRKQVAAKHGLGG